MSTDIDADLRPLVQVVAGILLAPDRSFLLASRPAGKVYAGYWEFPGGKIEPGETPEDAILRELAEELGVQAKRDCLAPFVFASHTYEDFHLLMPLFLLRRWKGEVERREHTAHAWVKPARLFDYAMPPADAPLCAWLRDCL